MELLKPIFLKNIFPLVHPPWLGKIFVVQVIFSATPKECTELPHYADELRRISKLPVFDAVTCVNYFFHATATQNWNSKTFAPHNSSFWAKNFDAEGRSKSPVKCTSCEAWSPFQVTHFAVEPPICFSEMVLGCSWTCWSLKTTRKASFRIKYPCFIWPRHAPVGLLISESNHEYFKWPFREDRYDWFPPMLKCAGVYCTDHDKMSAAG